MTAPSIGPTESYIPSILIGCFSGHPLWSIGEALSGEGWDVRILRENSAELATPSRSVKPTSVMGVGKRPVTSAPPEPVSPVRAAEMLVNAARAVLPDVVVAAGHNNDAWAFSIVRQLRSDPSTHDIGVVVFPNVSVPEDLDITPMSGPDAWVYLDARAAQAAEVIRRTVRAALDGHLEWAHRDWTPDDRRHHSIKTLQLSVENGRLVTPAALSEMLFGTRRVDIRVWDAPAFRGSTWRFGGEERYRRPLIVKCEKLVVDDHGFGEQLFTLQSRSGDLLIAAAHCISDLAGGWPTII